MSCARQDHGGGEGCYQCAMERVLEEELKVAKLRKALGRVSNMLNTVFPHRGANYDFCDKDCQRCLMEAKFPVEK